MSVETDLHAILAANAPLTAIVGMRIFNTKMPPNPTFPCVTFQRVATDRLHSLEGFSGLTNSRFQIDTWARDSFAVAEDLRDKIFSILDGFAPSSPSGTIRKILSQDAQTLWEEDVGVARVLMSFRVIHQG